MSMFMDVHTDMKGITAQQLSESHKKDLEAERNEKGVHYIKAWADPSTGKVFCLSEGPNKEAVQRVHKAAGHGTDEIYEVSVIAE